MSEEEDKFDEEESLLKILDTFYPSCFNCNAVECFQLHEPYSDDPNVMGDLYFGKFLFNKVHDEDDHDLGVLICTNNHLFQSTCFIFGSISENEDNIIFREIIFQAIRDLKASIFLATAGYYRNSMQVLRCSFETLLFGLYYYTDFQDTLKMNGERRKEVIRSYQNWKKGGVIKRSDVMTEIFRRIGIISNKEEKEWKKLYGNLSKYIHTPRSTWGKKVQEKGLPESLTCIAYNIFDKADFEIWSKNFRKIFNIIIKCCLYFEPTIKEQVAGQLAFEIIKIETKEQKIDDPLKEIANLIIEIQSSSDYIDLLENYEDNSDKE